MFVEDHSLAAMLSGISQAVCAQFVPRTTGLRLWRCAAEGLTFTTFITYAFGFHLSGGQILLIDMDTIFTFSTRHMNLITLRSAARLLIMRTWHRVSLHRCTPQYNEIHVFWRAFLCQWRASCACLGNFDYIFHKHLLCNVVFEVHWTCLFTVRELKSRISSYWCRLQVMRRKTLTLFRTRVQSTSDITYDSQIKLLWSKHKRMPQTSSFFFTQDR